MKNNCAGMDAKLATLLLDPAAASAKVRTHVEECGHCRSELEELCATMAFMESWEQPEPSPYFLTRLQARYREERAAEPEGVFARLRALVLHGPTTHLRPLAAMAMTVLLLVGGGSYLGVTNWNQPPAPPEQAAVVHSLQTMDSNAQLLDQLEALSSNSNQDNGN